MGHKKQTLKDKRSSKIKCKDNIQDNKEIQNEFPTQFLGYSGKSASKGNGDSVLNFISAILIFFAALFGLINCIPGCFVPSDDPKISGINNGIIIELPNDEVITIPNGGSIKLPNGGAIKLPNGDSIPLHPGDYTITISNGSKEIRYSSILSSTKSKSTNKESQNTSVLHNETTTFRVSKTDDS